MKSVLFMHITVKQDAEKWGISDRQFRATESLQTAIDRKKREMDKKSSVMKEIIPKTIQELFHKIKYTFKNYEMTIIAIVLFTLWEAFYAVLPYKYYKLIPFELEVISRMLAFLILPSLFVETCFAGKI